MNSLRRITASLTMGLLFLGIWSSVTHSQDERNRSRLIDDPPDRRILLPEIDRTTAPASPTPGSQVPGATQAKRLGMSDEEKLVRDLYARLMRYQSAAVDEMVAKTGNEAEPDEYLTFDLRD